MKHRLVELLRSPSDGGPLRLGRVEKITQVAFTDKVSKVMCIDFCAFKNCAVKQANLTPNDCGNCYSQEILEAELVSEAGQRYTVTRGIPRLLSELTANYFVKNQKSFSLEWKYSEAGQRNWGQDIEFRKRLFIRGIGVDPSTLKGKRILDAGCGSGLLTMAIANSYGMEVVALDLANGIKRAYTNNRNPHVHFVQASILEPPLKDEVADFVYCAGVLIHLPDTKQAFELLPRLLKLGGRLFVWIYRRIETHDLKSDRIRETVYQWLRRRITSRLPIKIQERLYLCGVLPFMAKRTVCNLFAKNPDTRTWREKMQNFIDTFSPIHVNRHTEEEVMGWFSENQLENVKVAYTERYGFGVRGDRLRKGTVSSLASKRSAPQTSSRLRAS